MTPNFPAAGTGSKEVERYTTPADASVYEDTTGATGAHQARIDQACSPKHETLEWSGNRAGVSAKIAPSLPFCGGGVRAGTLQAESMAPGRAGSREWPRMTCAVLVSGSVLAR